MGLSAQGSALGRHDFIGRMQGQGIPLPLRRRGIRHPLEVEAISKEVVAIDDDGNVVREFESAYDAAEKLGVINAAVYWALNEKHSEARCRGYRLRYKE